MKYQIDVVCRIGAMKKVQAALNNIIPGKVLLARQTFELDTKEPLTDEEMRKIEECCPGWADKIRAYAVMDTAAVG